MEKQVWDFRSLLRKHTDNLEEKNCHCLSTNHNYEVYVEGFAWGACDFYEKGAKWSLCKQSKPLHRFSIFSIQSSPKVIPKYQGCLKWKLQKCQILNHSASKILKIKSMHWNHFSPLKSSLAIAVIDFMKL